MRVNKSELSPKRKSQTGWTVILALWLAAALGAAETKTIVFFGDSITAGYGVDPDEAYPAVIQRKINEAGRPWRVVNAGLSGETTAGGLRRLDWILRQRVDLFVIELGGNDGLRGIPPATTRANLEQMVGRIHQQRPEIKVVITGMQISTNMGPEYTRDFAAIFPEVARTTGAVLVPFLLDRVGGVPSLNQPDGIHPTAEGHQIVADTLWQTLLPLL
jgi:acyl-CoA thioesterase-1